MKTLLITCIRGTVARNILSTEAFSRLRRREDLKIVIVASSHNTAKLEAEFGSNGVAVEGISVRPPQGLDKPLWVLATNLLPTGTREVQRLSKLGRDKNRFDYFASRLVGFLGRSRLVQRLFRWLVSKLDPAAEFNSLFERWRPDLVFATDIFELSDAKILRLAKRRGIHNVGMVRSWDNVTSKTALTVIPDLAVVNASRIKDELMSYGDVAGDKIKIVGVPHYDRYLDMRERTSREEFCRRTGLDPRRKIILFTPPAETYLRHDPVAPVVLRALEKIDAQVLVRLPVVGRADLGGYKPPPDVVLDAPASSPDFIDAYLSAEADRHLADSICHSNLVIAWASTMIVDAVVFDKPVILVGFDASPRPYAQSIRQYYDYDHQRAVIETGGARLAKNPEELIYLAERYLKESALDAEGRKTIREKYCFRLDGRSGERLADLLLRQLDAGERPLYK